MSKLLNFDPAEIINDKHLLFTLTSTLMFMLFSYPPMVKVTKQVIQEITKNTIKNTYAELAALVLYCLVFGICVYIFSVSVFDKILYAFSNLRGELSGWFRGRSVVVQENNNN